MKRAKPKSEIVVSIHWEETSLYRRHYHWCGTVLHTNVTAALPSPTFKDACQQHINNTGTGAPNHCQVHRQEAATATCFLSSLPRNPHRTTGPPSETLQTNSGSGRGFLSWAGPDLQLQRGWGKQWHQCEITSTYIYDLRLMLHQSRTSARAVCLTVWRHCKTCTPHGIPFLYHSHAIVRREWMGWDYYCLSSVT